MEFGMDTPKDYEWITFDCYGTLIDWENGISSAFEKVAKAAGAVFDRNQVLQLYHKYECIDYAKARANFYMQEALKSLNVLEPSQARENLESVAKFLVSRSY